MPEQPRLDPARLVVLDRIARQRRATAAGLADHLADLRDRKHEIARRDSLLRARADGDSRNRAEIEEQLASIAEEMATTVSQINEAEAQHGVAAAAATAAKLNLRTALDHARAEALAIPAGIETEVA